MRYPLLLLAASLLVACTNGTGSQPVLTGQSPLAEVKVIKRAAPATGIAAAVDASGARAIGLLEQWYNNRSIDCGGPDKPAYLCSGVWLRYTSTSYAYLPWDPSPGAIAKGGTSFAWLRNDQTFAKVLVENYNGYIFYPNNAAPEKAYALDAACTFPRDANTWERDTLKGCGPSRANPLPTQTCQALGINTAEAWIAKYGDFSPPCGWLLGAKNGPAAQWFAASMRAHQASSDQVWQTNNELIVSTWDTGMGVTLPILAFVFQDGVPKTIEARTKAALDQVRYFKAYGKVLPVVRMTLPRERGQAVRFVYDPADQALGASVSRQAADFEDVAVGSHEEVTSKGLSFRLNDGGAISDAPLPSPLINGRHAAALEGIGFGFMAQGPVKVSFSWGCKVFCELNEVTSGQTHDLLPDGQPDQWHFGRFSNTYCNADFLQMSGSGEDAIVIDNIVVEPATDVKDCSAPLR